MEPIFSLQYSEFAVVQELCNHLKKSEGFSAFLPLSRQQKGIDFLIHNQVKNKSVRFQVKASRSYEREQNPKEPYEHSLWFGNFIDKYSEDTCDYYCLFGLYSDYTSSRRINGKRNTWHRIVLCLPDSEMGRLLRELKTKRAKTPEKFFSIGFDDPSAVYVTRGVEPRRDVSKFLLASMVEDIRGFLS